MGKAKIRRPVDSLTTLEKNEMVVSIRNLDTF